jgi:hypothetical protein
MQKAPEVTAKFVKASGNVEITIDATKVNTMGGWRDVKLCLASIRPLGESALPEQWDKRKLPRHTACVAFAAIEKKDRFRNRLKVWRRRLRLGLKGDISAIADGASWIWDIVRSEFGNVRECLDVYHALVHLSNTGKVLYGEGTQAYERWYALSKRDLLSGGYELLAKRLDRLEKKNRTDKERVSLKRLRNYLSSHKDRLCYRERLSEDRAIGSGQVESACKSMVGSQFESNVVVMFASLQRCVERLLASDNVNCLQNVDALLIGCVVSICAPVDSLLDLSHRQFFELSLLEVQIKNNTLLQNFKVRLGQSESYHE